MTDTNKCKVKTFGNYAGALYEDIDKDIEKYLTNLNHFNIQIFFSNNRCHIISYTPNTSEEM